MANKFIVQTKIEITFSIPQELQEDYEILVEDITSNGSYIIDDVQEEVVDNKIKGSIIVTFEETAKDDVQDIIDSIEVLEQGESLQA